MTRSAALVAAVAAGVALSGCDKKPNSTTSTAAAPTPVTSVFQSGPPQSAPAPAAAGPALAQGLAVNGKAQAEVVEATRQAGVLTVRVRFIRTQGSGDYIETVYGSTYDRDAVYVVAGANKLFPLTDAADKPLMPPDLNLKLASGNPVAGIWFGKFPAPPPEVKTVSLVLPKTDPLDNIPITDR